MWTIYALVDPHDGRVRYVGLTSQSLSMRLAQHLAEAGGRARAHWIRGLAAAGARPTIVPLASCLGGRSVAEQVERTVVRQFKASDLTNRGAPYPADGAPFMTVGTAALRRRLKELGLSMRRAAAVAGMGAPHFYRIASGLRPIRRVADAVKILDAFGVEPELWLQKERA